MPVSVVRRGDEWCVEDSNGKRIGCHPTEPQALAQARAVNANIEKSMIVVLKEDDLRLMVVLSSNAFEDREEEIVKQKALERYVNEFDNTSMQGLLMWHGGDPLGEIIEAQMSGPFLFELVKEMPNTIIDLARHVDDLPRMVPREIVWDKIEANPSIWGASIGFRHKIGDEKDKAFDQIFKFETSLLPREDAANAITLSQIIKPER